MPLTQTQITSLRDKLKKQGMSDLEIDAGLEKFQAEFGGQDAAPAIPDIPGSTPSVATTQPQSQPVSTQPSTVLSTKQTPEQQGEGLVSRFFKSIYKTGENYAKFVGEAGAQAVRAVADPSILKIDDVTRQVDALSQQSRDLVQKAKVTTDPVEKQKLLDESRALDTQIEGLGKEAGKVEKMDKSFAYTDEEAEKKIGDRSKIAMTGLKSTAGAASLVVPTGPGLTGAVLSGATSGALFGLSEGEDIDVDKIISGAVGGAVGGAALAAAGKLASGAGNVASKAKNLFHKKAVDLFSDTAAENITKASPAAWEKAVTEHGLDLNALTKKYFKSGADYDTMLGPISKRGRGGVLADVVTDSEAKIAAEMKSVSNNTKLPVKEMVDALRKEKTQLLKLPGNEKNAAALDEFIKGFETQYGKGITPKRMLELKRVADSKFGQAVADETTGSATAQAQKMIANASRAKLKKLFPAVKEALDTETEVFTLQPVLSKARAVDNTRGSTIRTGKIGNVSLLNPLSWSTIPDVILSNPKVASTVLSHTDEVVPTVVNTAIPEVSVAGDAASKVGRTVGSAAAVTALTGEQPVNAPQDQSTQLNEEQNGNNAQEGLNHNAASIQTGTEKLQQPENNTPKPFGGRSKDELLQLALADGATHKDLDEISKIYDMIVPTTGSVDKLLAQRKTLEDAGFSTQSIDSQLEALGFTRVGSGSGVKSEAQRKFGPAVSRALDQLETISGMGTGDSVFQGGSTTIGKKVKNVGIDSKKATDEKFAQKVNQYSSTLQLVVGAINQMMGAGTLNEGEANRLLETMPNEYTSDADAQAWFTNARTILGVD